MYKKFIHMPTFVSGNKQQSRRLIVEFLFQPMYTNMYTTYVYKYVYNLCMQISPTATPA